MESRFERAGPSTTTSAANADSKYRLKVTLHYDALATRGETFWGRRLLADLNHSCSLCLCLEENGQNQRKIRAKEDHFNFHDDDLYIYNHSLEEIERRLFGIVRQNNLDQEITGKDFIPIRTGTGMKFMKNGPKHIMDAEDLEPLYTPQENILEECLRREAERVAH